MKSHAVLKELFQNNYIHLDIKPENIILSSINPID